MSSLEDLITVQTEDEQLEFGLTQLASEGFPVTAWDEFGVGLSIARLFARGTSDTSALVATLAKGGLLDLAEEDWLDLLAESAYQLTRKAATHAQIKVRLTRAKATGPDTIALNDLWIARTVGSTTQRYNNTSAGTLGATIGNTLDLVFTAEFTGSVYNIVGLIETLTLTTALAGVQIALQETSGGSGTALVVSAIDKESDSALRARCQSRWGTIGLQKTITAYEFLALNVTDDDGETISTGATRVLVDASNPRGAGTTDVYLAGSSGTIGGGDLAVIDAFLQERKGICEDLDTLSATTTTLQVKANVYVEASKQAAAAASITELLQMFSSGLSIGDGAGAGRAYVSALVELLMAPDGVVNCEIDAGVTTTTTPTKGQVIVFTENITYVAI